MGICELCGANGSLQVVEIEGVDVTVCTSCSKHGSKKIVSHDAVFRKKKVLREFSTLKVIDNFAAVMRKTREKSQKNQEEFARELQEKSSIVAKWESGALKPSVEVAKQIGKKLNLTLVEEDIDGEIEVKKGNHASMTIADLISIKRRGSQRKK